MRMSGRSYSAEKQPLLAGEGYPSGPAQPGDYSRVFNHGPRRATDRAWLIAYLLFVTACVGGGAYALWRGNPSFTKLPSIDFNDPATCPKPEPGRMLLKARDDGDEDAQWRFDAFMAHPAALSGAALLASIGLGLGFLALVKRSATALVNIAIGLQIGLPLGFAMMLAMNDQPRGAIPLVVLAGMLVLLFYLWREQVQLVTRLLAVAGHALMDCPGLIGLALGLQVAMVAAVVPMVVFLLAAQANGGVVYNPARDAVTPQPSSLSRAARSLLSVVGAGGNGQGGQDKGCTNLSGDEVYCCVWQTEQWVPPYQALVSLTLLWTTFLLFEIKVFTVGGTVAQWYFSPVTDPQSGVTQQPGRRSRQPSRVGTSLRHALGPQLGSLCFSSAVLTLVSYLRSALEKLRREQRNNLLVSILVSILNFFLSAVEFVTKFATIRMAITGEPLLAAGRGAVDLLKRNFMDAFGVWWLPPFILQNCSLIAALSFGSVLGLSGYAMWGHAGQDASSSLGSAWLLGGIAFLCAWVVLAFFSALLLNVIDGVFMCFAMDRDIRAVTRAEVHQVYQALPTVGPVVEQPDGSMQYGAPNRAPAGYVA